ncbi:MAG: hypothetical protein ABSG86_05735 [Thermoguttaceae bacterium]|jgi:hypothetical protein
MKSRFFFAVFCGAMILARQAVAQPAADSPALKLVAQVKEDADKDIRLNWVNHMALYGQRYLPNSSVQYTPT